MKILVVVDYQKDFVDGSLGFEGAEKLDNKIVEKIHEYEKMENSVIFYTMDTHGENYLETREGKQLPVQHCIEGTDGWNLYGKVGETLKDGVNATMIKKGTFGVDPADMVFKVLPTDVSSVELCGLVTNMCVISNAVTFQAKYPNAQIIVDSHLCDSFDKEKHKQALEVMESMQIKVIW